MAQFTSYLRAVLCKTLLIFPPINVRNVTSRSVKHFLFQQLAYLNKKQTQCLQTRPIAIVIIIPSLILTTGK